MNHFLHDECSWNLMLLFSIEMNHMVVLTPRFRVDGLLILTRLDGFLICKKDEQ